MRVATLRQDETRPCPHPCTRLAQQMLGPAGRGVYRSALRTARGFQDTAFQAPPANGRGETAREAPSLFASKSWT